MTIWARTIRLMPDFKTIADFRKNSGTAIRETVRSNQYRAICVDAVSFVPVPVEVNEIPVLSDSKQRVEATTGRSLEWPVAMRHVAWRSRSGASNPLEVLRTVLDCLFGWMPAIA